MHATAVALAAAADCFQACGTAVHVVPPPASRALTRAEQVARKRQALRGGDGARGWLAGVQLAGVQTAARRVMRMIWIAEDFEVTR